VAYGLRNPFRFTRRPGTNELWVGEVGFNTWEEINRVVDPADGVIENFGWPCYEGRGKQGGYDGANLALCEQLYADPTAVTSPHFSYDHARKIVPGEACGTGSSSVTALAFYSGDKFPPKYKGALFFGDYSRQCAWVMLPGADGLPDPTKVESFGVGVTRPVDFQMAPDGHLYYVDAVAGEVRRITYLLPKAVATGTPLAGPPPLVVNFDGSGSTKPFPDDQLTYAWDLDGDGEFDDASEEKPSTIYKTAGTVTVRLRVTDQRGVSVTGDPLTVTVSDMVMTSTAPVPVIDAPAAGAGWKVGDAIAFSGHATDAEDGALPASALSWLLVMQHCPAGCHSHVVQSFPATASGTFTTPDHEYPSYVELVLVATDSSGIRRTTSVRLDPQTVLLTLQSKPPGLSLAFGADSLVAPRGEELIVGGKTSVGAPLLQTVAGVPYAFVSWSDGQPASHDIGPFTTHTTLLAAYRSAGLTAQFFADQALTQQKVLRVDPNINFDWGRGSPDPAVPESFSARWSGFVLPQYSELYSFSTDSDDGVRVWVNGFLVLDAWDEHSIRRDNSTRFPLLAGRKARLRVEYYDNEVDAVAKLYWSSPSQPQALVPTERLYPGCVAGACPSGLTCIADECVADCTPACGAGQRCEAGACVDACKDVTCAGGKCVAGACVPRCQGVTCAAGTTCEPATGLCESACSKITCPAGQACAQGACMPACVVNGCNATSKCNPTSGVCGPKCQDVTCAAGFACAPETGTCQDLCLTLSCPGQACAAGECRPACVVSGCAATESCNATTGVCEPRCAAISCAAGAVCVPTTGECELPGSDGAAPGEPDGGAGDEDASPADAATTDTTGAGKGDVLAVTVKDSEGCGCDLGAAPGRPSPAALLLVALVTLLGRRRAGKRAA
jgi:PKD repeat protein